MYFRDSGQVIRVGFVELTRPSCRQTPKHVVPQEKSKDAISSILNPDIWDSFRE